MGDTASKQTGAVVEEKRPESDESPELAAAIAKQEEITRQEVLDEDAQRTKRHRDMCEKFPHLDIPEPEPTDYTRSYAGLFPEDVFNPDGTRKPGMKTKREKMAELHRLDDQG